MSRIFHPLLYILVSATRQELVRKVHYLKVENQALRNRLPKRILVTPTERRELVKAARGLGKAVQDLVTIVQPATLLKWTRKPGRPRTAEDVRQLIVGIATEAVHCRSSRSA